MSKSTHRPNFIERASVSHNIDGDALHDLFDDEIDAWHEGETALDLPEWLGMTEQEYVRTVEYPIRGSTLIDELLAIIEAHRAHSGGLSRVADSEGSIHST